MEAEKAELGNKHYAAAYIDHSLLKEFIFSDPPVVGTRVSGFRSPVTWESLVEDIPPFKKFEREMKAHFNQYIEPEKRLQLQQQKRLPYKLVTARETEQRWKDLVGGICNFFGFIKLIEPDKQANQIDDLIDRVKITAWCHWNSIRVSPSTCRNRGYCVRKLVGFLTRSTAFDAYRATINSIWAILANFINQNAILYRQRIARPPTKCRRNGELGIVYGP
jgi:hypothetical protein